MHPDVLALFGQPEHTVGPFAVAAAYIEVYALVAAPGEGK